MLYNQKSAADGALALPVLDLLAAAHFLFFELHSTPRALHSESSKFPVLSNMRSLCAVWLPAPFRRVLCSSALQDQSPLPTNSPLRKLRSRRRVDDIVLRAQIQFVHWRIIMNSAPILATYPDRPRVAILQVLPSVLALHISTSALRLSKPHPIASPSCYADYVLFDLIA
ncbi:hypothetical protein C8J57DRAFT_1531522 [Mycena rebaudengoi]|nr:hypothetical protein C8J57DRAFT_1531522 [Mycena rebaudengoi]